MKGCDLPCFSPKKEAREHDVQAQSLAGGLGATELMAQELPRGQRAEAFLRAFLKWSMPGMSQEACEDHLQRKAVVLEYFTRQKWKERRKKSKGLSARQWRDLQLFDIKPEHQRQPQMIQAKLLKADLHGAIISVAKSKCLSYVEVTGILLQETKHVFKIITKEDCLKVIPKLNCVFTIEIDGFVSYIYRSKFQLWSSEWSAKKFKAKGTIDL